MTRTMRLPLLALVLAAGLAACDSAEPDPQGPGEQELITRVVLTLDPADGDPFSIEVSDDSGLTGDGGVFDVPLNLAPGATYAGSIRFLDESDPDDVDDITEEVRAEGDEHQVFYVVEGVGGVTFDYADEDANGRPLGLAFTVAVAADAAGSGTLRVVLAHYGERPKGTGETVDAAPETDVDFRIPLVVLD